ncbi:MAG: translocation/assembly module TamB [Rhodothermaceae bacterium]|nr:MAG: translocation/assembly module TamB [Rhodothermaceae bacterium]
MPLRLLIHIPRKAIVFALYALLAGIVLFFALTRTEVGRDALRRQIERQFATAFEGRLQIGHLTGNLVNTLTARDVRLYAPDGALVIAVDTVVVRPHWLPLLRRRLNLRSLELVRPYARLHRFEDGRWNLAEALHPRRPDTTAAPPWDLAATDLLVHNGILETSRTGPPPEPVARGRLFDYTASRVDSLTLHATIDWRAALKQIDLLSFRARLDTSRFVVDMLEGQLVWEDSLLTIPQLRLIAGQTSVSLAGSIREPFPPAPDAFDRTEVSLNLSPSRIDLDALRRLFPALPLADAVQIQARLQGPLSALVVEEIDLTRGRTRLAGGGTLFGLPDSLDVEVALRRTVLRTADLRAVLPTMNAWQRLRLDSLAAEVYAVGKLYRHPQNDQPRFRLGATVDLQGRVGSVVGTVDLHQPVGRDLQYAGNLYVEALDLGRLLRGQTPSTSLFGHLTLQGQGTSLDSLTGTLSAALNPLHWAGRRIDTLALDLAFDRGRIDGGADLRLHGGRLDVTFALDTHALIPTYRIEARADAFDLGPLAGEPRLTTDLNARLTLAGSGFTDPDLQAGIAVAFDSSTVQWGDVRRLLAPHRSTLRLARRGDDGPRLSLSGDMATLRIDGDLPLEAVAALGRLGQQTLAASMARERTKVFHDSLAAPPRNDGDALTAYQNRLHRALRRAGLDTLALHLTFQLRRSDLLSALLPMLPALESDLQTRFDLEAGEAAARLTGHLEAGTFRLGGFAADSLRATLAAHTVFDAPLADRLRLDLNVLADSSFLLQGIARPRLRLTYASHRARLDLASRPDHVDGPLHLHATLDVLPDRNRITLDTLRVRAGRYVFYNPEPEFVDLFTDALVVPSLQIVSRGAAGDTVQRLRLHGILSSAPSDTIHAEAEAVVLRHLTDFIDLKPRFGGRLDGRVALTGGLKRPALTGRIDVTALALDQHILGDLHLTSRYLAGRPDVGIDLQIRPTRTADTTFVHGTNLPAILTRNHLDLTGSLRLPERGGPPGQFDLRYDIERADLFFFEKIIGALTNVSGYARGTGTMTGPFSRPVFQADLAVRDGAFDVPDLNLHLTGEADVSVDADAIRIRRAAFTDKTGGTLEARGAVLFNDYAFFSFDIQARLDRVQIIDVAYSDDLPFYGHLWASGTASLTGPLYNAHLRSNDAVTTPNSELFIPVTESTGGDDESFIIFADSTGRLPDLRRRTRRSNVLASRPEGERPFLEGLDLDIDLLAPPGSTVHLVIDPLLGDVINAVGSGRIQLQRREGEFYTFGTLHIDGGDYLFTAGEVFVRRFLLEPGGTITWDGDPIDALLDIPASYRTRASRAGLPVLGDASDTSLIPLIVRLYISGRVTAPDVKLSLAIDRSGQSRLGEYEGLEALLNQPERATEYATSVLLTNSFRLTTTNLDNAAGGQLAFNSLSQLVSSQLNRFLNAALPNVDFSFGLQGENTQDLDVTYGVALRLLDERLIIRGEGVYQGSGTNNVRNESLQGEFVVEIRLNPNVSVEIFYRREGDVLAENTALTNTTGAGLSYQTEFSTWRSLLRKLFGWLLPDRRTKPPQPDENVATGER